MKARTRVLAKKCTMILVSLGTLGNHFIYCINHVDSHTYFQIQGYGGNGSLPCMFVHT